MAAQFCMACGKPLPTDAQFCLACGKPTGYSGAASASPPPAPLFSDAAPQAPSPGLPPTDPAASTLPPLGSLLGVEGGRSFLLQHELLSGGRNYRVLSAEKRPLFTVRENVGQELWSHLFQARPAPEMGLHFGVMGAPTLTYIWSVEDAARNIRGVVQIQVHGNRAVSTLVDAAGAPVLAVGVERGLMGKLNATAAFPDGRTMFQTQGNLLRHNFSIRDASGAEVAKIHEAFASVRDTYHLDLTAPIDPLFPLVFAVLIDREKEASSR
jgi:hypothetical protein